MRTSSGRTQQEDARFWETGRRALGAASTPSVKQRMNTSTTTSLSSPRPQDSLWVNSVKMWPRFEVVDAPAPKPLVTTVQISPVRAPPEITRAIRRQKQAAGIVYSRVPEHARPELKVVLSGNFHPDFTRFIVTPSHCLSRVSADYYSKNSNHDYSDGAAVRHNHRGSRRSRSLNSGRGNFQTFIPETPSQVSSVTWSRRNDIYHRQAAEGNHNNLGRQNIWRWYQDRYHTPLSAAGKSAIARDAARSSQDETQEQIWNTNTDSTSGVIETNWKQGHVDSQNVPTSAFSNLATAGESFHIPTKESSRKATSNNLQLCTNSSVQRTVSQDGGKPPSVQPFKAMPCLQLADAILESVGGNLDHLYKLCQTKYRYYEYFENFYPRVLLESSKSDDHEQTSSNYFVPLSPSLKSQHLRSGLPKSSSSSSSSSPLSLNSTFPNEPVGDLSLTTSATFYQNDILSDHSLFQEEVEGPVSNDDPQKVKMESDSDKQPMNTTRSILKAPRIYRERGRLYTDNFVNSLTGDWRSPCQTLQHNTSYESNLFTVTRVTRGQTELSRSSVDMSKDKGRLVRFSADDKIHEFTSLEPIASSSPR